MVYDTTKQEHPHDGVGGYCLIGPALGGPTIYRVYTDDGYATGVQVGTFSDYESALAEAIKLDTKAA